MGLFRRTPRPAESPREVDPTRVVRAYHERTKHQPHRYALGPPDLDWATQPAPFRHWTDAPRVALARAFDDDGPTWAQVLRGEAPARRFDAGELARLLYESLALSAAKEYGASRWTLRVNPSSGNLHPTEAHLVLPALDGLTDAACVAHYDPEAHALELRAELDDARFDALRGGDARVHAFVALTSIHWREAWKYGERAWRYCQHDTGHALAALSLAAAARGWRLRALDELDTQSLEAWLGAAATAGPEAEVPALVCALEARDAPGAPASAAWRDLDAARALAWRGTPSALSSEHVAWEVIDVVAQATRKPATDARAAALADRPAPRAASTAPFGALARARRSAVAMDGASRLSLADFIALCDACLPRPGLPPWEVLPGPARLHLVLFVHRVDGLEPGVYLLLRDEAARDRLRAALRASFTWEPVPGVPAELPLVRLHASGVRGLAAHVSCHQEIAGAGAFAVGMLSDFDAALADGAWRYPRLYWEAGALGQVLYLEAERAGLAGTGIGCFFDDAVHAALGLAGGAWQSLYHFTVGGPLLDTRIVTRAPYAEARA
ncbi:MAG: SagB/ThcOx family dehydrogenase [Planctomycetes bacterium]|nr:SagB/ThcOx family dehydrogenase [Planctomycetota bacterium]